MNVQKGDLARIVGSQAGNNDKIVEVLEYAGLYAWKRCPGAPVRLAPTWKVSATLQGWGGGEAEDLIEDALLRPIRDPGDDAVDEVLVRVGRPTETPAEVIEAARALT